MTNVRYVVVIVQCFCVVTNEWNYCLFDDANCTASVYTVWCISDWYTVTQSHLRFIHGSADHWRLC